LFFGPFLPLPDCIFKHLNAYSKPDNMSGLRCEGL